MLRLLKNTESWASVFEQPKHFYLVLGDITFLIFNMSLDKFLTIIKYLDTTKYLDKEGIISVKQIEGKIMPV